MSDLHIDTFKRTYQQLPAPQPDAPDTAAPVDAFEGWESFDKEYPAQPCRTIAITPEILAEEAAKEAAREIPTEAWPIKAELSEDNLRLVKRKLPAGRREAPRGSARIAFVLPPKKRCEACKGEMGGNAKYPNCKACRLFLRSQQKSASPSTTTAATPQPAPTIQEPIQMSKPVCLGGCGRTICPSALKQGSKYAAGCSSIRGCQQRKRVGADAAKPAQKTSGKAAPPPCSQISSQIRCRSRLHSLRDTRLHHRCDRRLLAAPRSRRQGPHHLRRIAATPLR